MLIMSILNGGVTSDVCCGDTTRIDPFFCGFTHVAWQPPLGAHDLRPFLSEIPQIRHSGDLMPHNEDVVKKLWAANDKTIKMLFHEMFNNSRHDEI